MTNYKWVISALDSYPKTADDLIDVICVIHWRYQAEQVQDDKTYFAEVYGASSVPSPDPADFVPYEEVTYEMVCDWLESILDIESLNANVDSQIADQITPKIVTLPLPFANPELTLQIKTNNEDESNSGLS